MVSTVKVTSASTLRSRSRVGHVQHRRGHVGGARARRQQHLADPEGEVEGLVDVSAGSWVRHRAPSLTTRAGPARTGRAASRGLAHAARPGAVRRRTRGPRRDRLAWDVMSYADPRYLGRHRRASARRSGASTTPPSCAPRPAHLPLPRHRATHGRPVRALPLGDGSRAVAGPGPHFHRTMSESFFVLTGTVLIYDGTAWVETHPGDFTFVPEGGDARVPQRVG